jgi:predicted DNA-binding protein
MSKRDKALAALDGPLDWAGADVDDRPRNVQVVQSVRMPRDLTERLAAEAQRRGITPSDLVRELVRAGLDEIDQAGNVVVNLADLHRVIEGAIKSVARDAA